MAYGYIQAVICNPLAKGGTARIRISGATSDCAIFEPLTLEPKSQPLYVDGAGMVPEFVVERGYVYDLYFFDQLGAPVGDTLSVTVNDDVVGVQGPQGPQGEKGDKGDKGDSIVGPSGADGVDGADGADGNDGISLISIRVDENSTTGKVLYNLSNDPENWIEAGDIVPSGLGQVKVSSSDSLGYLEDKVTSGAGISIVNSGTNLAINNDAPETFKTQASQYSTVKDFLNGVIEGTSGITVSVSADFNKIILSGAGIGGSGFTPRGVWDSVTTYDEGDGVWYYDSSVTPVINRYYVATATNTNVDPYTDGTGWVMMFSIDQLGDQLVKLDASDSTASFLLDKIVAGTGITFTRTVDAGGDFITIDGAPVWSIGVNGVDKTIADVSNTLDFVDGEVTEVTWDGNTIKVNHDTFAESGTIVTQTATGLPKFDEYGHYKGENDAIEISDVNGLEAAIDDAGDGKVSVDNSDTKGYLKDKLTAFGAVELFEVSNSPSDKDIQIVGTGKVATDSGDAVGFLENKVLAGDNVTITKVPHLTGESLEVSVSLPELDDDEPIIAEFGNPSSIYLASNNTGNAIDRVAGKYTEFPMNSKRIDNKVGGSFSTMNGVFSPEKNGYYVCTFNAYVHPSSSTSRNQNVYLSCSVETSYDGTTWVDYGGSDSTKMIYVVFPSTGTYPDGYGKPMTFHMVVHLKDNEFSGDHMMARIMIRQLSFGAGYDNSMYIKYPQFAWYELKKPVGIQGPKGDTGTVTALGDIPDVDISGATDGQVLTYDDSTSTWIPTTVSGGGGADTYTVKVDASDASPNYLSDKIVAAVNSPLTVNVVGDTLELDTIESDITDPLIQTIGLMNENGTMGFTGNAYSSTYADGEWGTGFGQNTSDAYYRVSTIGRGTINKVKFYVNAYNDVDLGIAPTGNYGAIRIGLFTLDGVCKGSTAWTRGLQTLGTVTLPMVPEAGQNLTLERNGEYWIGIVARGMQLISYNKTTSGFDPGVNALRYAVSIRSTSSGADWSPNFWNSTGGGFIQVKVPCVLMASTES